MGYDITNVTNFPTKHKSLTPNDSTTFDYLTNILVLGAGNVAIADEDGVVVTYTGVPAFTVLPCLASKLMATNTTAVGFIGIYGEG